MTNDPGYVSSVIRVYRRIQKACTEGKGVHLSADEVHAIWRYDDAISQAVYAADEMDADLLGEQDA